MLIAYRRHIYQRALPDSRPSSSAEVRRLLQNAPPSAVPPLLTEMSPTLAFVALPSVHPTLRRSSFVSATRPVSSHRPPPVHVIRPFTPVASAHPSRRASVLRGVTSIITAIGAAAIPLLPTPVRAIHISSPQSLAATQNRTTSPSQATFSKRIVRVPTSTFSTRSLATVQQATQQPLPHSRTSAPVARASPLARIIPNAADPFLHKFLKLALLAGIVTCIVTAATISVFWIIQDSLVYKPTKVWRGTPDSNGMPHYEDVNYCTVDGVEIVGWFIKQPPHVFANARTLVYFHGTDKNASFRLKKVIGFYEKCRCNVLLLSYRGYGPSTGKPNERGMRIDAESAFDYLKSRHDVDVGRNGNLWVYGESLGGAVAIYFSNLYQHCINALILENTFTSLLDMIKLEFPILGVFRYLSRNRWQSKKRIKNLAIPLLFLSGLKDSYIPPAMMKQMHSLAGKSPLKEFVEFEDGTHNRTWATEGFYDSVATFMDRVEKERKGTPVYDAAKIQSMSG